MQLNISVVSQKFTYKFLRRSQANQPEISKEALTVGEKAQQKKGMADCAESIIGFAELAKIIGYEPPRTSPRK
jgi:hypothetical protein